jgi:hypothetical protein
LTRPLVSLTRRRPRHILYFIFLYSRQRREART